MIDIVSFTDGKDFGVSDTQVPRAANILSVRVQTLEYAPDLGIDLDYFLSENFEFQNDSFKSYCVQVLANNGINVASVTEAVESLYTTLGFNLLPENNSTSLIAR